MSRVYDSWEKLVGAVLKREELRRLALCESFSSSISADFSSRFSFDSSIEDVPLGSRNSGKKFDPAASSSQSTYFFRNATAIEFEEIKIATQNFQHDISMGEGAFRPVLKGWLHEQYLTAVKPESGIAVGVTISSEITWKGHQEWSKEIMYMSQLRHPNVIELVGYSFKEDIRILVFEYMPKGNLANYLSRRQHPFLSWATRIKVATGAARGLSFLHDLVVPVIHRNFHSGTILLDDEFNAKLDDFSLAIDGPTGGMTHVSTQVMGRYAYAAPEYIATGHLTTKCDVYGFGVVLLELLSGRRAIDQNRSMLERNLVNWARPYLGSKRKLLRIMDTDLEGQYLHSEARKVAFLSSQCLSSKPEKRPRMAEVVAALEGLLHPNAM